MDDPTPLSTRQLWALATATTRELLWGLRAVSTEIAHWRDLALAIPDPALREDALDVLKRKRTHAEGAALFWILPKRRNYRLLRLLVAYELIWDLLDNMSERAAAVGQIDGYRLHRAIAEALDPFGPSISDYYAEHPWSEDAGYLRALVEFCRRGCASLPAYAKIREIVIADAELAQVLALNHDPHDGRREASLKRWVKQNFPDRRDLDWWELSGAASAPLHIHVLLAIASEPGCSEREISATRNTYFPWVSASTTMLDSFVDHAEDVANGDHSYITHYPNSDCALRRVWRLFERAAFEVRALPRGHKHAVITAAMGAMYLSKRSHGARGDDQGKYAMIEAGGSLACLLLPILRAWRIAYAHECA